MRTSAVLSMIVLPFVLAHGTPLERRMKHKNEERQLIPIGGDDPEQPSSMFSSFTPPTRVSSTSRDVVPSATPTSARPSSSRSSVIASPSGSSVISPTTSDVSSLASSVSGSVSSGLSSSTSSISSSANVTSAPPSSSSAPSSAMSAVPSIHTSVDAGGQVIIITQYYTPAAASVSSAAAAASSSAPANDGPSIPIGAIIGISVAVGVIILALIGCAVWRMKRRNGDEDEAIRWPELNRHGDSDAHHALPARATGKHGIETDALERTMSNSSEMYMSQPHGRPVSIPMALNGSNFGANSALDYTAPEDTAHNYAPGGYDYGYPSYAHDQSGAGTHPHAAGGAPSPYDGEDYTSFPPPVGIQPDPSQGGAGAALYESDSEGDHLARKGKGEGPPVYRV